MSETVSTCLHPGCGLPGLLRGRCRRHYEALRYRVKKGELTWDEAIRQGLCLPCADNANRSDWMERYFQKERRLKAAGL